MRVQAVAVGQTPAANQNMACIWYNYADNKDTPHLKVNHNEAHPGLLD